MEKNKRVAKILYLLKEILQDLKDKHNYQNLKNEVLELVLDVAVKTNKQNFQKNLKKRVIFFRVYEYKALNEIIGYSNKDTAEDAKRKIMIFFDSDLVKEARRKYKEDKNDGIKTKENLKSFNFNVNMSYKMGVDIIPLEQKKWAFNHGFATKNMITHWLDNGVLVEDELTGEIKFKE